MNKPNQTSPPARNPPPPGSAGACFNRFVGVGEEMTRGCVLTFLWGRLHREKKDWEREKENVLHHRPTTERRNIKRNKKLNF